MLIDLTKFRIRSGAIGDTEVFDGPAVLGWYEGENWTKSQQSLGLGLMAFVGQVDDQVGDVQMIDGQTFVERMNSLGVDVPRLDDAPDGEKRSADRMITDAGAPEGEFPDE